MSAALAIWFPFSTTRVVPVRAPLLPVTVKLLVICVNVTLLPITCRRLLDSRFAETPNSPALETAAMMESNHCRSCIAEVNWYCNRTGRNRSIVVKFECCRRDSIADRELATIQNIRSRTINGRWNRNAISSIQLEGGQCTGRVGNRIRRCIQGVGQFGKRNRLLTSSNKLHLVNGVRNPNPSSWSETNDSTGLVITKCIINILVSLTPSLKTTIAAPLTVVGSIPTPALVLPCSLPSNSRMSKYGDEITV